jgi:hypothetical protein
MRQMKRIRAYSDSIGTEYTLMSLTGVSQRG